MRALWRFAVEAKWVDEALPGPAWTIVPVCKDIGETNMRMVREFLTTTGMSFDDQEVRKLWCRPFHQCAVYAVFAVSAVFEPA